MQFLTLLGAAVYVVDAPYYDPQDAAAAARLNTAATAIAQRADVDPNALVLFSCCGSAPTAYEILGRNRSLAGLIDLGGLMSAAAQGALLPRVQGARILVQDFLRFEPTRALAESKRQALAGPHTIVKQYDTDHYYRERDVRAQLLHDWENFLAPFSPRECAAP